MSEEKWREGGQKGTVAGSPKIEFGNLGPSARNPEGVRDWGSDGEQSEDGGEKGWIAGSQNSR